MANNSKGCYKFDQEEEQPSPYDSNALVLHLGSIACFFAVHLPTMLASKSAG